MKEEGWEGGREGERERSHRQIHFENYLLLPSLRFTIHSDILKALRSPAITKPAYTVTMSQNLWLCLFCHGGDGYYFYFLLAPLLSYNKTHSRKYLVKTFLAPSGRQGMEMRVAVYLFARSPSQLHEKTTALLKKLWWHCLSSWKMSKSLWVVFEALDYGVLVSLSVSPPAAFLSLHR